MARLSARGQVENPEKSGASLKKSARGQTRGRKIRAFQPLEVSRGSSLRGPTFTTSPKVKAQMRNSLSDRLPRWLKPGNAETRPMGFALTYDLERTVFRGGQDRKMNRKTIEKESKQADSGRI